MTRIRRYGFLAVCIAFVLCIGTTATRACLDTDWDSSTYNTSPECNDAGTTTYYSIEYATSCIVCPYCWNTQCTGGSVQQTEIQYEWSDNYCTVIPPISGPDYTYFQINQATIAACSGG